MIVSIISICPDLQSELEVNMKDLNDVEHSAHTYTLHPSRIAE